MGAGEKEVDIPWLTWKHRHATLRRPRRPCSLEPGGHEEEVWARVDAVPQALADRTLRRHPAQPQEDRQGLWMPSEHQTDERARSG